MGVILFKDDAIQFDATGKVIFTQAGDDPADCACCGDVVAPCVDCPDTANGGADPKVATVSGVGEIVAASQCATANGAYAYSSFNGFSDTTDYCEWTWTRDSGAHQFRLRYTKNAYTWTTGLCSTSLVAGEWAVQLVTSGTPQNGSTWQEKTTGFSCDPTTNRVSGTHIFGAACISNNCTGTPTVTVDP
jgi:hypothetical protein